MRAVVKGSVAFEYFAALLNTSHIMCEILARALSLSKRLIKVVALTRINALKIDKEFE